MDRRTPDLRSRRPRLVRHGPVSRLQPPSAAADGQGTGDSETAALRALEDRLRGVPQPNGHAWPNANARSGWPTWPGPNRGPVRTRAAGGPIASTEASFDGSGE